MGVALETSESLCPRAHVDRVHIDGLQRTKDDYVTSVLSDLFKVDTLQDLLTKSAETRSKLEKLGCFKNVQIHIDTSRGSNATPDIGYDVTFKVVELSSFTGGFETNIENNQGSIGGTVKAQNFAGRGELLQSELRYSSKKWQTFYTTFTKPFTFCDGSFKFSMFREDSENGASGYKMSEYGTLFGPSFIYSDLVNHKIEYENIIRNVKMFDRCVPFIIREASGYTMKSAIKNWLKLDNRDSKIFPSTGSLLELKSEVAGIGGNIGFVKNEIISQVNAPLGAYISVQGSFAGGIINETTKDKSYSLVDRFFIGGPLTLRGFQLNSVGPNCDGFSLGGSLYCVGALHLYSVLPHMPQPGSIGDLFRIHIFCNAGNLIEKAASLKESCRRLGDTMRLTYGIGLACRLGQMARIELNYCIPVQHRNTDKLVDGVQFGIGVHFL